MTPLWSILICTLPERSQTLKRLENVLNLQISGKYDGQIEIIVLSDNREKPIGQKRNELVTKANGEYVCFIDDDDLVSDDYISSIMAGLVKKVDCVSIVIEMTINGRNPILLEHSLRYADSQINGRRIRPPFHLNAIRTAIARKFPFKHINAGEDLDFGARMAEAGVLRTEHLIEHPIYFYLYDDTKRPSGSGQRPLLTLKPRYGKNQLPAVVRPKYRF